MIGGFCMKLVYPVVISKGDKYLIASVPDCRIDTQGENMADVIEMARDAISIWCVAEQDNGRTLPSPSDLYAVERDASDVATLIDVDIDAYRKKLDNRTIRKNLTLPSWLNEKAEQANLNFSRVLQQALKAELQIAE
jgi:predicted RNase H-like HicB family nuclease